MSNEKTKLISLAILVAFLLTVGGYCWEYSIETVSRIMGKDVDIALWHGVLLSIVPIVGQAAIPLAAVVWILSLFL